LAGEYGFLLDEIWLKKHYFFQGFFIRKNTAFAEYYSMMWVNAWWKFVYSNDLLQIILYSK
jgi:hypothetical protein